MKNYVLISGLLAVCGLFYAFVPPPLYIANTASTPLTEDYKNVQWMSWEEAIAEGERAKAVGKTPKKIFVDIYTHWCGWCKKMDRETFEQKHIADYLNEHFYPVKFNAEQREPIKFQGKEFKFVAQGARGYHELAAALLNGKMSYPTVVFLTEDIKIIQPIPGYLNQEVFEPILRFFAGNYYQNTKWETFLEVYNKEKTKRKNAHQTASPY